MRRDNRVSANRVEVVLARHRSKPQFLAPLRFCVRHGFVSRKAAKARRKSAKFEGAPGDERFMFTGHQWDGESGLYQAPFRYYSPFQAH